MELARVSVWIGHIQWARRHGYPAPSDPVLRTLDTIACRDALLAEDGSPAAWPKADVIIGNPAFLSGKRLRTLLGDAYYERLIRAYADTVPAEADLVCYWASGRSSISRPDCVAGPGWGRRIASAAARTAGCWRRSPGRLVITSSSRLESSLGAAFSMHISGSARYARLSPETVRAGV